MNDIAPALSDTMDFDASLTTTNTGLSFDSATAAATNAATSTAATTTAVTTTTATTTAATTTVSSTTATTFTAITVYTSSLDISTITSNPSPVTFSLEPLSHLSSECFCNWPVRSQQEGMGIAAQELSPQNQVNFILEISDLFGDITDAINAEVAWQLNCAERNLNWEKLKYKQYNDFLKALDSSGRVREII